MAYMGRGNERVCEGVRKSEWDVWRVGGTWRVSRVEVVGKKNWQDRMERLGVGFTMELCHILLSNRKTIMAEGSGQNLASDLSCLSFMPQSPPCSTAP